MSRKLSKSLIFRRKCCSEVECDFTKFNFIWLFRANFLGSEYFHYEFIFILRLSILGPKSLWKLKENTFPGRMLLIRKDSIKKSMNCVHPKMHPSKIFETENFRKFSKIFIENYMKMKIFEIENFRNFWSQKIFKIFIGKCMKMKIFETENFRKFSISKNFEGCIFGWTQIIDFFIESSLIKSIRPGIV